MKVIFEMKIDLSALTQYGDDYVLTVEDAVDEAMIALRSCRFFRERQNMRENMSLVNSDGSCSNFPEHPESIPADNDSFIYVTIPDDPPPDQPPAKRAKTDN